MEYYRPSLIEDRTSEELLQGIVQTLRELINSITTVIKSETKIRKIQLSYFELEKRGDGVYNQIDQLEKETGWLFNQLFEDCIAYPDKELLRDKYLPYSEKKQLCFECGTQASEIANSSIQLCNDCLKGCIEAIHEQRAIEGCLLFKTPEQEYWCEHADDEMLLLALDKYYLEDQIVCTICLGNEQQKRANQVK